MTSHVPDTGRMGGPSPDEPVGMDLTCVFATDACRVLQLPYRLCGAVQIPEIQFAASFLMGACFNVSSGFVRRADIESETRLPMTWRKNQLSLSA
jgi:hypothetical protein